MKFIHFLLFFYIIFAFLDPDLQTQFNPDPKHLDKRARAPLHCTCSFLCIEIMEADSDVQISRLAIKNPPKKTHLKKPKKNGFLKILNFYENNTNFSL
jgi:hypothetical protein